MILSLHDKHTSVTSITKFFKLTTVSLILGFLPFCMFTFLLLSVIPKIFITHSVVLVLYGRPTCSFCYSSAIRLSKFNK